jgi:hypothetical protein
MNECSEKTSIQGKVVVIPFFDGFHSEYKIDKSLRIVRSIGIL